MPEGGPINIGGIVIPSDHPAFLTIIAIHVSAGLTCVIAGLVAMLVRKQRGTHTRTGKVYFASVCVVFATACIVAFMRWEEDFHLFILGVVSFSCAFAGRRAVRKKWRKWPVFHITGMALSYIFLLIAFYVDNGKFLPVWKYLDPVWYWVLPLVLGFPLLVFTLYRNPLSNGIFRRGEQND